MLLKIYVEWFYQGHVEEGGLPFIGGSGNLAGKMLKLEF